MGRILLIIVVVVAAILVAVPLFGMLMGLLKWVLIIGAIFLGIVGISKLMSSRTERR